MMSILLSFVIVFGICFVPASFHNQTPNEASQSSLSSNSSNDSNEPSFQEDYLIQEKERESWDDALQYHIQKETANLNQEAFTQNVLPIEVDPSDPSYIGGALPTGFVEVEYIESTGTQYIDTGFIPTENTKVKGNFALTEVQNSVSVFGCFNTAESRFNLLVTTNLFNKITGNSYITSNNLLPSVAPAIDTNYNFEISLPNYIINGSSYTSGSYSYTSSTSSLYIFSRNTGSSPDQFIKMKLYNFEIYDDGALICKLVPCYRKIDNVIGLYDLANTGLNIWDEEWEAGRITSRGVANEGLPENGTNQIRTKNYVPVSGNTKYYFRTTNSSGIVVFYYDESKQLVDWDVNVHNQELTTPANCSYIKFYTYGDYGSTYKKDICVNVSDANRNGTYEPNSPFYTNAGTGSFVIPNVTSALPSNYHQIEYIESYGAQYIDTGISAVNGYKIVSSVSFSNGANKNLSGIQTGGGSKRAFGPWAASQTGTKFSLGIGVGGAVNTDKIYDIDQRYEIETNLDATNPYLKVDGVSAIFTQSPGGALSSLIPDGNIYLFALNNAGSVTTGFVGKVYGTIKIYVEDLLVREFVPCYDLNNVVGVFDLVENKFYCNKGTGLFNIPSAINYTYSLQGSGTEIAPYQISSALDMAYLSYSSNHGVSYDNKYIQLTNDIVLNDGFFEEDGTYHDGGDEKLYEWVPISKSVGFRGWFDGHNHTISGMYINSSSQNNGLFGLIAGAVNTIKNLSIDNSFVSSSTENTAGFCGLVNADATIENVKFNGKVRCSAYYSGGLIGRCNSGAKLFNCSVDVDLKSTRSYCGGLLGYRGFGGSATMNIKNCVSRGKVESAGYYASGMIGQGQANLSNCKNYASVKGGNYVAGIVGYIYGSCSECENNGIIEGVSYTAGIIGFGSGDAYKCVNKGTILNKVAGSRISGIGGDTCNHCDNYGDIICTAKTNYASGIGGTAYMCQNSGNVFTYGNFAFGISYASVSFCTNRGNITGNSASGIGVNTQYCVNYGNIVATGTACGIGEGSSGSYNVNYGNVSGNYASGIGGVLTAELYSCVNYGNITGTTIAGGIATSIGKMTNCINFGEITGNSRCAGLARRIEIGVTNCIVNCSVNGALQKQYWGTDFSAFFHTYKDGRIGLIRFESTGFIMEVLTENFLQRNGFEAQDHVYVQGA